MNHQSDLSVGFPQVCQCVRDSWVCVNVCDYDVRRIGRAALRFAPLSMDKFLAGSHLFPWRWGRTRSHSTSVTFLLRDNERGIGGRGGAGSVRARGSTGN